MQVAFLNADPAKTTVKEICTWGLANLVTVSPENPIDRCMEKLLHSGVRHLLIRRSKDKSSGIIGMISVKDIVKCTLAKNDAQLHRLEDIVMVQEIARGL